MLEKFGMIAEKIKEMEKEDEWINSLYNKLEKISDKIAKGYGFEKRSSYREIATRYGPDHPVLSFNSIYYWKTPKEVRVTFGVRDFTHEYPFFEVKTQMLVMNHPTRGKFWTPDLVYGVRKDVEPSLSSIFKTIDERLETILFKTHFRGADIPDVQKSQVIPIIKTFVIGTLRGKDI